jgi:hypothetical protein
MASKQGNWSLWLNSADRVLYTRLVQRVIRGCIPIQQRSSATCGYSSVGRAFDLGSNSRGFDSRYPRNLSRCVTGKDLWSVVRLHMRMIFIHKRRESAAPYLLASPVCMAVVRWFECVDKLMPVTAARKRNLAQKEGGSASSDERETGHPHD